MDEQLWGNLIDVLKQDIEAVYGADHPLGRIEQSALPKAKAWAENTYAAVLVMLSNREPQLFSGR